MFAGAAIVILASAAGHAQAAGSGVRIAPQPHVQRPAPAPDGLKEGELYLEADLITRDDQAKRTTAEGSVEVRYEGRTLRADRLVYDEGKPGQQGVIRAFGHVQIINADGSVEFADQFTLDDKMQAGVALGFSARLSQNAQMAGETAVRRSEDIQELNHAIYTPCPICTPDGKAKRPTWSIAADRVVEDKRHRVVYYRNARIHVLGVPVLYLPLFWHADPSADRASGLLTPRIAASNRRGFSYEQPYLWAVSPYTDIIIAPQVNTKVNPLLEGEVRKRFYSGDMDIRFGYTYDKDFDGSGHKFGDETSRSFILGRGAFRISDDWRWGFTAEQASDKLIFDKYDIGKVYESRGPYVADDRRLISQLYAVRQDERSYFSTAAIEIQGLRPDPNNPTVIENDRVFPVIGPLVESHFEPGMTIAGGRLRFHASGVALTRDQSPDLPQLRLPGLDSRRVTVEADWRRAFTSPLGLRVEPFVDVRADGYNLSDILTGVGSQTTSKNTGRALAVAGADISYPLYRRWRDATVVVEPLVQVALSPSAKQIVVNHTPAGAPVLLNEDSVAFELDESTLFRPDKFPGYDLYEDGMRLNVGGRGSVLWDDGRRGSLLIGRSFRDRINNVFPASTGLRDRASDWIVAAEAQPVRGFSFFGRARLDSDTLDVHRLEAGMNVANKFGSGYVRYLTDDSNVDLTNPLAGPSKLENMDVGGEVYLTKNWGVSAYGNRDFVQNAWVIRDLGVFYHDDCVRVDVIYRKEDTVIGRLGPSEQITVRLTLATLGGATNVR